MYPNGSLLQVSVGPRSSKPTQTCSSRPRHARAAGTADRSPIIYVSTHYSPPTRAVFVTLCRRSTSHGVGRVSLTAPSTRRRGEPTKRGALQLDEQRAASVELDAAPRS